MPHMSSVRRTSSPWRIDIVSTFGEVRPVSARTPYLMPTTQPDSPIASKFFALSPLPSNAMDLPPHAHRILLTYDGASDRMRVAKCVRRPRDGDLRQGVCTMATKIDDMRCSRPPYTIDPLVIYGGDLDLVDGENLSEELAAVVLRNLKIAALFYKYILIPDTFVYTYGPIYNLLKGSAPSDTPSRRDLAHTIKVFFQNGILVPAIRRGDSIWKNWNDQIEGIKHGVFGCLPDTQEVGQYLQKCDRYILRYTDHRPEMQRFGEDKFYSNLEKYVFSQCYDRSYISTMPEKYTAKMTVRSCLAECREFVLRFGQECRDRRRGFRRGTAEDILARMAGIDPDCPNKYFEFNRLASQEDPSCSYTHHVCADLYGIVSTIYQVQHSLAFSTVGGLFHAHRRWLIDEGLYGDTLVDWNSPFMDLNVDNLPKYLAATHDFRVDWLRAEDIVNFRAISDGHVFGEYCRCRYDAVDDKSVRSYLEYLGGKYIPLLHKHVFTCETARATEPVKEAWPLQLVVGASKVTLAVCVGGYVVLTLVDCARIHQADRDVRKRLEPFVTALADDQRRHTEDDRNRYTPM